MLAAQGAAGPAVRRAARSCASAAREGDIRRGAGAGRDGGDGGAGGGCRAERPLPIGVLSPLLDPARQGGVCVFVCVCLWSLVVVACCGRLLSRCAMYRQGKGYDGRLTGGTRCRRTNLGGFGDDAVRV